MNQRRAMAETVLEILYDRYDLAKAKLDAGGPASYNHLLDMLIRVHDMGADHGDAKLGRWLGYMQGVLVARGVMTLDEAKEINRRNA